MCVSFVINIIFFAIGYCDGAVSGDGTVNGNGTVNVLITVIVMTLVILVLIFIIIFLVLKMQQTIKYVISL